MVNDILAYWRVGQHAQRVRRGGRLVKFRWRRLCGYGGLWLLGFLFLVTANGSVIRCSAPYGDDIALMSNSEPAWNPDPGQWFTRGYSDYFTPYPAWSEPYTGFLRPLVNGLYFLRASLWPSQPFGAYLPWSYALLAALAVLVYHLARRVLYCPPAWALSAFAAFLVCPALDVSLLHRPAFAAEPLAALLASLGLLMWFSGRKVAAPLLFFLAMLAKETAVIAPVAAAVFTLASRDQHLSRPCLAAAADAAVFTLASRDQHPGNAGRKTPIPWSDLFLAALPVLLVLLVRVTLFEAPGDIRFFQRATELRGLARSLYHGLSTWPLGINPAFPLLRDGGPCKGWAGALPPACLVLNLACLAGMVMAVRQALPGLPASGVRLVLAWWGVGLACMVGFSLQARFGIVMMAAQTPLLIALAHRGRGWRRIAVLVMLLLMVLAGAPNYWRDRDDHCGKSRLAGELAALLHRHDAPGASLVLVNEVTGLFAAGWLKEFHHLKGDLTVVNSLRTDHGDQPLPTPCAMSLSAQPTPEGLLLTVGLPPETDLYFPGALRLYHGDNDPGRWIPADHGLRYRFPDMTRRDPPPGVTSLGQTMEVLLPGHNDRNIIYFDPCLGAYRVQQPGG